MVQSPLPFPAMGLSRRILDERLLDAARARGAAMMRGRSVRTIAVAPAGVSVALSDGTALTADALFLATGKPELRGHARPRGTRDRFIGLKMHQIGSASCRERVCPDVSTPVVAVSIKK